MVLIAQGGCPDRSESTRIGENKYNTVSAQKRKTHRKEITRQRQAITAGLPLQRYTDSKVWPAESSKLIAL